MKNKKLNLIIWVMMALVLTASAAMAQNICTKQVDDTQVKLYIRNATEKSITVNYVDESCKESASDDKIEPGRAFEGDTTNGHAYRVREADSNKLLQTVVADPSNTTVTIGIIKNSDPRQSFIETLNQVRRGRNLPPIELNDSLNKSCQWFAEHMAKYDKGGHDAVEVGGSSYADMQHPGMRSKKMGYIGDGGTEATGQGDVTNITSLGGDSMMGWSSSNTHFRPFLSQDNQIFKQVGFGYAKSAKKPNYYYTCAVFGNPSDSDSGGGNNDSQGNNDTAKKEPIKTEVPDGLKFTESKFFQTVNGENKFATTFNKGSLDELQATFSFENPSSQAFHVEARSYLNGKVISSQSLKDLEGSGGMDVRVAGEPGKTGKVAAGNYRFEILLNGEVVLNAEAVVKNQ